MLAAEIAAPDPLSRQRYWLLWQYRDDRFEALTPSLAPVNAITWSPDGRQYQIVSGEMIGLFSADHVPLGRFQARQLAWSADGSRIVVVIPHSLQVFDATTLQLLTTFRDSESGLSRAEWSPDGRYLAAVGRGRLIVWDVATHRRVIDRIKMIQNPYPEYSLAPMVRENILSMLWSPDSQHLAVSYRVPAVATIGRLDIFSMQTGQIELSVGPGVTTTFEWSGNSRQLIGRSSIGTPYPNGIRFGLAARPDDVRLSFQEWESSPDGLLTGVFGRDNSLLYLLDRTDFRLIATLHNPADRIRSVSWASDNQRIVLAMRDELQVWDVQSQHMLARNIHHVGNWASPIGWSPDGRYLAYRSHSVGARWVQGCASIRIWDKDTEQIVASMGGVDGLINVNWHLTDNRLLIGGITYSERTCFTQRTPVFSWDIATDTIVAYPITDLPQFTTWNETGDQIAVLALSVDGTSRSLWLLDADSGDVLQEIILSAEGITRQIGWFSDDNLIVLSNIYVSGITEDHQPMFIDPRSGDRLDPRYDGIATQIDYVALHMNTAHKLMAYFLNDTVTVYRLRHESGVVDQDRLAVLPDLSSFTWSPGSQGWMTGLTTAGQPVMGNIAQGFLLYPLSFDQIISPPNAILVNPDGAWLATGEANNLIKVWQRQPR